MPLPSSLDYRERYEPLPKEASKHTVSLQARNGSSFVDGGDEIIFDFYQTGYLVPNSLHLRFKLAIENGASNSTSIVLPFYNVFSKLETIIDDKTVDCICNYGQTQIALVNLTMNVAQKFSNSFNLGITTTTGIENLETLIIPVSQTTTVSLAGYIPSLLSNCDKLIPLQFMGKISMIFTTNTLVNIISNISSIVGLTIINPEISYDCVILGEEYDKKIMSLGKVFIESQSFSNSSVFLKTGANGNRNINFNSELTHVKCAFITFSSLNSVLGAKILDAVDITNDSGAYSMTIGTVQYPQVEMSALNNKSGILMELKKCVKAVFGNGDNFSINDLEFGANDNFVASSTQNSYGKFILPFLFQYINMKGEKQYTSVKNKIITLNIKQSVAQSVNRPCNLLLVYKAILEIDIKKRLTKVIN